MSDLELAPMQQRHRTRSELDLTNQIYGTRRACIPSAVRCRGL
jgi:hypothetical protein